MAPMRDPSTDRGPEGVGTLVERDVQVLIAQALMLALDHEAPVTEAGEELARHSHGSIDALDATAARVEALAHRNPGPDARRLLAIVEEARRRIESRERHPSRTERRRLRLAS